MAKADALRSGEAADAVLYQGIVDGLQMAITELDRFITGMSRGEAHLPMGSG